MRWESRLLDFSTERLFNSLFCRRLGDGCAVAGEVPQPARSVRHADGSVQMLVDEDVAQPASHVGQRSRWRAIGVQSQPFVPIPNSCWMARTDRCDDLVFARKGNDERF